MESHDLPMRFPVELRSEAGRALVASSLWLRVGFVGACTLAVAVMLLWSGQAKPMFALASALAGGLLVIFAWRRAWTILDRADASAAGAAAEPSAAGHRRTVLAAQ